MHSEYNTKVCFTGLPIPNIPTCLVPNEKPNTLMSYLLQVYYFVVDSPRNEGKDYFEINSETGEVFTKIVFDREKQGAYALEVEARDGAPSARPNNGEAPNSGIYIFTYYYYALHKTRNSKTSVYF